MPYAGRFGVALVVVLAACGGGGGGSDDGGPVPPPAALTLAAAGDIADCRTSSTAAASPAARTAALLSSQDALVLTLGDTTYPAGAPTEFANCFHPTWGAFKDRIRPAVGNHEYQTPGAEGYFSYFGSQAGPDRRGYYSFDFGGWHFISLNSNIDAGPESAQVQWLNADLAGSRDAACSIAYWHVAVFSSGKHGNNAHMAKVFEILHAAGVDIVLYGHDHVYERFAPQNASGIADPVRGIRAFTVGTGGAELYVLQTPRPNSEFRYNASHGILRLALSQDGYSWQFVAADGGVVDSGRDSCRR